MSNEQAENLNLTLAIRALSAAIGSLEETIRAHASPPSRPSSGKTKAAPR